MQQPSLSLKSTVTRRQPVFDPVDADERQLQAEHHQAAESAAQAANEAATATQATEAVPRHRSDPNALQAVFLAGNLGKPVTVYLTSGVRLSGKLAQYDQYCLLMKNGNEQQLVFKHVVSTIIPTAR